MKKHILLIIIGCSTNLIAQTQNVGIDTTEPARKVDVNGNLRITSTNNVTNSTAYDRIAVANNTTGDVDYISLSAITQTSTSNLEVKRTIYNATLPDQTKECNCGDITFRISNSNIAQFKFNSQTLFVTNNATSIQIGYGVKRWTGSTYNFVNRVTDFTNLNFANYQSLDLTAFPTDATNTVRVYTILPPKQNNLYRLTLSRVNNTPTNFTYSLICEKFYIEII